MLRHHYNLTKNSYFHPNTVMKCKRYSLTGSMIATITLIIIVIMLSETAESVQHVIAKEGCPETCGDVQIPYPFGIGSNCSLKGFELDCNTTNNPLKPYLFNVAVQNITLSSGQVLVNNGISSQCYNSTFKNVSYIDYRWNLSGTPFRFNDEKNKFTVIGCDTVAYIYFGNESNLNLGGCVLRCSDEGSIIDESCSGIGCCQTVIPKQTNYYKVEFASTWNNSYVYNFSRCSYAVLMKDEGFVFSSDYITTNKLYKQQWPVVLDWAIGNKTCDMSKADRASYACISDNSVCVDSTNGPGYFCSCLAGYEGYPYIEGGCQDIDECAVMNPCSKKCHNSPGSYTCSCPAFQRLKKNSAAGDCELPVPFLIGIGGGSLLLVLVGFCMYMAFERRKLSKVRKKYFQQHGGRILLEKTKSDMGFSFTIFSKQERELATNRFDNSNIIGQGGQGTVYKGTIKDRLVAIKKCQVIDEGKKKEFGKEMIILSETNHKNIVKLLGCCLEVEVPMLVYEFISNGTLYHHIHHKRHAYSLPLEVRLRIAHESAEALAYLHYSVSPPIFHGDVKSSNILLDENFIAKVSDFGASILVPTDESQFVTLVQGTCGYLDPEYLQSCQLTDKSDVYSFGVVLLELLTSMPVIDFNATTEEKSLSSLFLSAMKDNKMYEFLDVQIKREEDKELIYRVAELAKECLHVKGEDRPTMKEVADELDRIRKLKNHPWGKNNYEEMEILLGESSIHSEIQHTGNFSIERNVVQNIALGR